MKKNNTKVELKKYLSQKEKIKNTFISSCIILVVLTFLIFITYSYFINKTGEIDVGNTYAAIPEYDVEIISKEGFENANAQQTVFTIYNFSSTNTYSYNLKYFDQSYGYCGQVYYKIPSGEYSHPEGIIKPNEEKKILLVTNHTCIDTTDLTMDDSTWDVKLNLGYEYTPIIIDDEYQKIEYSPLESTTELRSLVPGHGTLEPSFNPNITDYNLIYNEDESSYSTISFNPTYSSGSGSLSKYSYPFNDGYKYNIKFYAEDGTYINTYNIHTLYKEMTGIIEQFRLSCHNDQILISTPYKTGGYANNSTITFTIRPSSCGCTSASSCNVRLKWFYLDGDIYLKTNNPNYYYLHLLLNASRNDNIVTQATDNYIEFSAQVPNNYKLKIVKIPEGTELKIYNIKFVSG